MVDVDEHVITCELGGIVAADADVWKRVPALTVEHRKCSDRLTICRGRKITVDFTGAGSYSSNAQTSTLTIAAAEMATLGGNAPQQTFTCTVTVGKNNDQDVTATQTITILDPSTVLLKK